MIELHPDHFIGKGRTRTCHLHPDNPDLCIKIDRRKSGGPTEKEARYYAKLSRIRPDLAYTHIPRFHGFVETSLGCGGVFDLIRDETSGRISKTLSHYIRNGEVTAADPLWVEAHRVYMETLHDEAVVIRDFNPGNLCVRMMRDGSRRLVTIDGIGHRDFLPLCDYSPWFARRKLRRQVARKHFESLEEILSRMDRMRKPTPSGKPDGPLENPNVTGK